jgi:hypothetical protein
VHLVNPRPTHPPADFFSLEFLVRFWAFLGKGSSKTHTKNRKKSMLKNPKPIFVDFFYHVFGRLSVRGVQNHPQKISGPFFGR